MGRYACLPGHRSRQHYAGGTTAGSHNIPSGVGVTRITAADIIATVVARTRVAGTGSIAAADGAPARVAATGSIATTVVAPARIAATGNVAVTGTINTARNAAATGIPVAFTLVNLESQNGSLTRNRSDSTPCLIGLLRGVNEPFDEERLGQRPVNVASAS